MYLLKTTLAVTVSVTVFFLLFLSISLPSNAIRSFPTTTHHSSSSSSDSVLPRFAEAPEYRNGPDCPTMSRGSHVHIAMTLDSEYLRGSMAAILSVLKHASCPENVFFHFVSAESDSFDRATLTQLVRSTFPSLNFKVYYLLNEKLVKNLISSSIRQALENPLNYARNYLAEILPPSVNRVIYLDSDLLVVDDIQKLWSITLSGSRVIGAPEYCHANFTKYFTDGFWWDPVTSGVFEGRKACYFNMGVMVMELGRWREGEYMKKIEG